MTNHDDRRILIPYIRQSRAVNGESEDSSLSLSQQEDSIKAWGERAGYHVLRAIRDHDETGRTMQRPGFLALKEAARPGVTIAVYKYDRFARNLIGQEQAVAELEAIGADVVSVTDPPGKLPRQIMGSIAEYFSDQLSERLIAIRAAEARAGRYIGATPPYGYRRSKVDVSRDPVTGDERIRRTGPLELDPVYAPIVREIFARVAAGDVAYRICVDLQARGVPTLTGASWSVTTIRRMLRKPFYRGVIAHRGHEVAIGLHEPMVDEATWFAVQDRLDRAAVIRRPRTASGLSHWLEGHVVHACGARMYLAAINGKTRKGDGTFTKYPNFVCGRSTGNDRCGIAHLAVSAPKLEAAVRRAIAVDLAGVVTVEGAIRAAEAAAGGDAVIQQRRALQDRRRVAERRRERARELWLNGDDTIVAWDAEQLRYRAAIAEIERELADLPDAPNPAAYRAAAAEIAGLADLVAELDGGTMHQLVDTLGTVMVGPAGIVMRYRVPFSGLIPASVVIGW